MQKIIILPGWGQNKQYWQGIIDAFAGEYDMQAIDLPGFGEEPLVSDDWGIPEYADWVMNKLSHESGIILLGHSFGGRIAAYIAAQKPAWLKSVILYGAPLLYRPSKRLRAKQQVFKVGQFLPQQIKDLAKSEELRTADAQGLGKIFRKAVMFDQEEILPQIAIPAHLIWGEEDNEAPVKIAYEAANLISDAKLYILPNCGHNVHIENQHLFYGTVKKILAHI